MSRFLWFAVYFYIIFVIIVISYRHYITIILNMTVLFKSVQFNCLSICHSAIIGIIIIFVNYLASKIHEKIGLSFQNDCRRTGRLPQTTESPGKRKPLSHSPPPRRLWRLGRRCLRHLPFPTQPSPLAVPSAPVPVSSCSFSERRMHQNAEFCITNIILFYFPTFATSELPRREGKPLSHPLLCSSAQSWCPSASFWLATTLSIGTDIGVLKWL